MDANKFKEIFSGLNRARGAFTFEEDNHIGKSTGAYRTVKEEPQVSHYETHLKGNYPSLGIVPINDDNMCTWGCIDVDQYPLDHKKIITDIRKKELPLIVCQSKSLGAHIFLFSKTPAPAATFQKVLKNLSATLGFAGTEIFPKQTKLIGDDDVGSWLNLPYFGETRYAFLDTGDGATLQEFFDMYDKYVCDDIEKLAKQKESKRKKSKFKFDMAPPCLRILESKGYPEGTRNNGLFNVGVFYRKAFPNDWENLLQKFHQKYMPDFPMEEVIKEKQSIMKNADDGSMKYFYRCNDTPAKNHCNKELCATTKFGIKKDEVNSEYPVITELHILNSVPPVYYVFADSNGKRLRTRIDDEDHLLYAKPFRKIFNRTHLMNFPKVSEKDWDARIDQLYKDKIIIDAPEDASTVAEFLDYLQEFCLINGRGSTSMDELSLDRAYFDEEAEKIYFKLETFQRWLQNTKNYKKNRNILTSYLKDDAKAEPVSKQVNKKSTRCWELDFKLDDNKVETKNLKIEKPDDNVLGGNKDDEDIPF